MQVVTGNWKARAWLLSGLCGAVEVLSALFSLILMTSVAGCGAGREWQDGGGLLGAIGEDGGGERLPKVAPNLR